ncbi:hypothetical protein D3C85_1501420 [compost metagenome]
MHECPAFVAIQNASQHVEIGGGLGDGVGFAGRSSSMGQVVFILSHHGREVTQDRLTVWSSLAVDENVGLILAQHCTTTEDMTHGAEPP